MRVPLFFSLLLLCTHTTPPVWKWVTAPSGGIRCLPGVWLMQREAAQQSSAKRQRVPPSAFFFIFFKISAASPSFFLVYFFLVSFLASCCCCYIQKIISYFSYSLWYFKLHLLFVPYQQEILGEDDRFSLLLLLLLLFKKVWFFFVWGFEEDFLRAWKKPPVVFWLKNRNLFSCSSLSILYNSFFL